MKFMKSFSLALMALMITAMLLVACGDSPTPVPAATTAAATATTAPKPTTAAATTAAATTVVPTTAGVTTAAPTTAAPTTAVATTAAATGTLPVPAGTRTLKLSPTLTQGLISQFAKGAGTTNVAFEAYATTQAPIDLSTFYDSKLVELGYTSHPETHQGQQQGNAMFLSASFTKGNQILSVALVGPVDAAVLNEIAGMETASPVSPDMDITKQLKAGDTLILSFVLTGTLPTVSATVAASTTAAATVAPATTAASGTSITLPVSAKALNLSPSLEKALTDQFGEGAKTAVLKTYATSDDIDSLASYFESTMPAAGYTLVPDSQTKTSQGSVNALTAAFTNGTSPVVIAMVGPLDDATISQLSAMDPETPVLATSLKSQVKAGDTIVFVITATK